MLQEGQAEGWIVIDESRTLGPGRSTADEAFNEVKKQVARRNEEAHKAARKLPSAREKEEVGATPRVGSALPRR